MSAGIVQHGRRCMPPAPGLGGHTCVGAMCGSLPTASGMKRRTSASVRGGGRGVQGRGGHLGGQRLAMSLPRGVILYVHLEATQDIIVNTVDNCRQLPSWGCNRSEGIIDHIACNHRLSIAAESDVTMILSPTEVFRNSYHCIHPHKTVCKVAAGPPRREALQMQDGRRIPIAGLLRGWRRSPKGGISTPLRPKVVRVTLVPLFWGICRFPPRSDCVACGRGGHKAWRCLRTHECLGRWPLWCSSRWLGCHLPTLLTPVLAFARRLLMRHMWRANMGSRSRLPIGPAPFVWRTIEQEPGCIRVGGPMSAPSTGPNAPRVMCCAVRILCAVPHCFTLCSTLYCVYLAALYLGALGSG